MVRPTPRVMPRARHLRLANIQSDTHASASPRMQKLLHGSPGIIARQTPNSHSRGLLTCSASPYIIRPASQVVSRARALRLANNQSSIPASTSSQVQDVSRKSSCPCRPYQRTSLYSVLSDCQPTQLVQVYLHQIRDQYMQLTTKPPATFDDHVVDSPTAFGKRTSSSSSLGCSVIHVAARGLVVSKTEGLGPGKEVDNTLTNNPKAPGDPVPD